MTTLELHECPRCKLFYRPEDLQTLPGGERVCQDQEHCRFQVDERKKFHDRVVNTISKLKFGVQ
jgi:hypothetical protein